MKPIGTFTPDNLIADSWPPATVMSAALGTAAALQRGQLLGFDETAGTYAPMAEGLTPSAVVATTMEEASATAEVYRSGHFIRNELILGEYSLTAADEEALRRANIYLSDDLAAHTDESTDNGSDTSAET